jgi:superfamily II DNA or RNA helicase
MSYFSEGYSSLRLPVAEGNTPGLRRAQLGAIHAIGAYFSLPRKDPGIVVMPTASGKTAVICLTAFVLRAERVLILTPSQLVRSQIAEQMASLVVLKRAGVLPEDFTGPKVKEVKQRLTSTTLWKELASSDFAVATPQCVSPGLEGIVEPPEGLFDLILMDEAHHSEAPRWADILAHFHNTKRVLFTATPFRGDKKELRGHMLYSYPLSLAHEDGIFGKLRFIPVDPPSGIDHDIAIARRAEEIYDRDAAEGFDHRLMVRTGSKKRAGELAEIYRQQTKLKLAVIHSGYSLRTIRRTLDRLIFGEINGIISVAMMGEGFDFPRLKIAAIHKPHKSLAVTLQFIGRFARTTGERLGEAKFLAVPQDIEAETNELYHESAAWQEIVSNLSAARIEREVRIKEIAASFSKIETGEIDAADVLLTDFTPYFHVKIYRLDHVPDLRLLPDLGDGVTVLRHDVSDEHNSSVLLLRQVTLPRWTDLEQFSRVEFDLVIFYFHDDSQLLFINSSRRTLEFYKPFEDHYGGGNAVLIPGARIHRVLTGLQNPDFFSVGLKNTVQNSNTESYQIKAGPSAQNAISPTDGLLYQRGHIFGRGFNQDGEAVTIGYSSSSKVWSNCSARIGELIEWCQQLAVKLLTKGPVLTGTPLDTLEAGEEIEQLPDGLIGVGWPDNVFKDFPKIKITTGDRKTESQLLDVELSIDFEESSTDLWTIIVAHEALHEPARMTFAFQDGRPTYKWVGPEPAINLIRSGEEIPLIYYLTNYNLAFYLDDFSRIDGATILRNKKGSKLTIHADRLQKLEWSSANIDIELEFSQGGMNFTKPTTVQEFLGQNLINSAVPVVFYDHGSGEMADFLAFGEGPQNSVLVQLYHCKGSGGPAPGDRVNDAYEVCGQVVKCLVWLKKRQALRNRITHREQSTNGKSRYVKGTRGDLLRLLSDDTPKKLNFEIILVQPGISIGAISEKIGCILGAASDYVSRASGARMLLIGS